MGRKKERENADWEYRRRSHHDSWESDIARWEKQDSGDRRYESRSAQEEPDRRKYGRRTYGPDYATGTEEDDQPRRRSRRDEVQLHYDSGLNNRHHGRSVQRQSHSSELTLAPGDQAPEPFLDFRILVSAIYENKSLILLTVLGGMVLGGLATTFHSSKYTAETTLYFDPARLSIVWDGQNQSPTSAQTAGNLVNSQIEILTSTVVLRSAVEKYSLNEDPEFGEAGVGTESIYLATDNLRESVATSRVADTYVVSLRVTTSAPQKSADIANAVVDAFIAYENTSAKDSYTSFSANLDERLEELRKKAFAAEKAVEDYRAKNDLLTAKGALISDDRLSALNTALVQSQQKTIVASAKVDAAERLNLQSAVASVSDSDVSSASLVQLRRQHATAFSQLSRLKSQLGSRHPSIAEAEASLSGIRGEINNELKRIASIAQTELSQARKAQDETAKELAAQKALKLSNSPNQAALDNLLLQAATSRSIYESILKSTSQSDEEFKNTFTNVRVLGLAAPPQSADKPGKTTLLIGGLFGGAFLGFGIGLMIALAKRLMRNRSTRRYMTSIEP